MLIIPLINLIFLIIYTISLLIVLLVPINKKQLNILSIVAVISSFITIFYKG